MPSSPVLYPSISLKEDDDRPAFTCTLCWLTHQQPSKPRLLGKDRIVCCACYENVLDLSICWVCGEIIVRDEEVVSLGWCFWHLGCFGCLLCGFGLEARKFVDIGGSDGMEVQGMSRKGWELERVPLCRVCEVETTGDSREAVLERGVEVVSKSDGGLGRERLRRLGMKGRKSEIRVIGMTRASEKAVGEKQMKGERNDHSDRKRRKGTEDGKGNSSLAQIAQLRTFEGRSVDGTVDFEASEEEEPEIYLSIFDPIREPAFRPTRMKPMPRWMRLLPHNRERGQGPVMELRQTDNFGTLGSRIEEIEGAEGKLVRSNYFGSPLKKQGPSPATQSISPPAPQSGTRAFIPPQSPIFRDKHATRTGNYTHQEPLGMFSAAIVRKRNSLDGEPSVDMPVIPEGHGLLHLVRPPYGSTSGRARTLLAGNMGKIESPGKCSTFRHEEMRKGNLLKEEESGQF
jgi:hypothetical protein